MLGDSSSTAITALDADGVALAALQGLSRRVNEQDGRIDELEDENEALRDRLDALEGRVSEGEDGQSQTGSGDG